MRFFVSTRREVDQSQLRPRYKTRRPCLSQKPKEALLSDTERAHEWGWVMTVRLREVEAVEGIGRRSSCSQETL